MPRQNALAGRGPRCHGRPVPTAQRLAARLLLVVLLASGCPVGHRDILGAEKKL